MRKAVFVSMMDVFNVTKGIDGSDIHDSLVDS